MKKLLCVLLVFIFNFSVFAQTESYLYERYGIVNQYTNNTVLPIDGTLKFIKNKDDLFTIQMTDSQLENTFVYELTVSLNGYDELDEKYIYIGNVVREGVAKGKCIISTSNKLDIYLNNKGYEYKGSYYDNDFHENLSLSMYFKNMKIFKDGYISSIPDTYIKIYPIRNITKEEKEAIVLFDQNQKKLIEKEQEEIVKTIRLANIEKKLSIIKDRYIEYYKDQIKEQIFNVYKNGYYYNMHTYSVPFECKLIMLINDNDVSVIKECINYYGIKGYINNKRILNTSMNKVFENTNSPSYKIEDFLCKKDMENIFIENYTISDNFKIKTGIMSVKVKNKKQKYYFNEHEKCSQQGDICNWCYENIKDNGLYFIQYLIINEHFSTCKILNVNKDNIDNAKRHLRIGFLNK